ncbi:hypothetical protein [Nocardioides sp. Leaf285]|uniref:hypothetical protein n=1 Tax=Nocardioides sp. Leaf285 TaxID=1736322 RepID=UPI000702A25C|nr:hypothetical protein [Nocardioides sp. Leaf285]KQP62913.1 hypothetical protein ASF47_18035 [Nocardioides sp. Leaf285]
MAGTTEQRVSLPCSGCMEPFEMLVLSAGEGGASVVDTLRSATVTMAVPANGVRGRGHQAAHEVRAEAEVDATGTLLVWDCPRCGYADSVYADPQVRASLS